MSANAPGVAVFERFQLFKSTSSPPVPSSSEPSARLALTATLPNEALVVLATNSTKPDVGIGDPPEFFKTSA
jgi:hypothetical protein